VVFYDRLLFPMQVHRCEVLCVGELECSVLIVFIYTEVSTVSRSTLR